MATFYSIDNQTGRVNTSAGKDNKSKSWDPSFIQDAVFDALGVEMTRNKAG